MLYDIFYGRREIRVLLYGEDRHYEMLTLDTLYTAS